MENNSVINPNSCDERTRLLNTSLQKSQNNSNNSNISSTNGNTATAVNEEQTQIIASAAESIVAVNSEIGEHGHHTRQKITKPKLGKIGGKNVGLKRVSFGSSKGSMVETLVFETPTPLLEHMEPNFGFESHTNCKPSSNSNAYSKINMDDSGIEVQEESERSIVRVSIYQSNQLQQIYSPEYLTTFEDNLDNLLSNYNCNIEEIMTASTIPGYDRQQSTDSGWDNPFRPGGDLSREADEIVNMIKDGKPITPTEDLLLGNGNAQREENCNGNSATENVMKKNVTQVQSAQNGTNSHKVQSTAKSPENNGVTSLAQVSKQVVPGPTSASHVVIDEKKNKKKGCCTIQ